MKPQPSFSAALGKAGTPPRRLILAPASMPQYFSMASFILHLPHKLPLALTGLCNLGEQEYQGISVCAPLPGTATLWTHTMTPSDRFALHFYIEFPILSYHRGVGSPTRNPVVGSLFYCGATEEEGRPAAHPNQHNPTILLLGTALLRLGFRHAVLTCKGLMRKTLLSLFPSLFPCYRAGI